MSSRRLLTPRWLLAHVAILATAAVCVSLGLWQLDRHGEESEALNKLEARLDAPPVPLRELVPQDLDADTAEELEYRPVTVTGTYVPEDEVLVRSQSYEGTSGYHVLTPLVTDAGEAVLVNRGWVPFELDSPPLAEALPPDGSVEVTGFLEQSQVRGEGFGPRDPAEGRLERVFFQDVDRIQQQVDYSLVPMLVQLTSQRPASSQRLPIAAPPPEFDPTQNMSYALQWFSFAGIAVVGYAIVLARQRRRPTEADPESGDPTTAPDVSVRR